MTQQNSPTTEIMKIDVPITEITNKAMRQIKLTTDTIAFLYHAAINHSPETVSPLQTDSLPIMIQDPSIDSSPEAAKQRAIDWIFKKAFEEFIVGLTESLIEAYKFVKFLSLSLESKNLRKLTGTEISERVLPINTKPHKMNFPDLINEIEKEIDSQLQLREEILSINNLRNCLVHRNGIVTALDTKNEPDKKLRLHYLDLMIFYQKENEMVEMKWEHKKNGLQTNNVQFLEAAKTLGVDEGAHVHLDQNIFNGVSYTCIQFIQKLYAKVFTDQLEKIKSVQPPQE